MSNLVLFRRQDFSILVAPEAIDARDEAIAAASLVPVVKDKQTRDSAVDAMKGLKALLSSAENNRKALKAPVLDLGKKIDATAESFSKPIQEAYARVDTMVVEWETEQRELARKIELARERELQEAAAKIEADRLAAERERMQIELEKEREIQAVKDAGEKARLEAIETERRKVEERKRHEEALRAAEALEQKRAEMGPPVNIETATGQSVREVWDFEVQDIHKLYISRGQQCVDLSVKRAAVLALINAGGQRDIPGLRIFTVTKNQIRPAKERKAIDV